MGKKKRKKEGEKDGRQEGMREMDMDKVDEVEMRGKDSFY